ncbi:MAG TPA: nitrogen fixation protein FixH [Rhodobacteraceae bacterium]|nr:nitrogen fixation protein FixH [Paracoccaceae bacterium]
MGKTTNAEIKAGGREFTGRHMLLIVVAFFAVIVSVNLFMAYSAVSTFSGLEVRNGYVASQQFNRNRDAQEALGWTVLASFEGEDYVRLDFTGENGAFIPAETIAVINATIGRPTERQDDQDLIFERTAEGYYLAPIEPLRAGKWYLRLMANAADGTLFNQRLTLYVSER